MNALVWVDAWQQQCCGTQFRVGTHVRWTVYSPADRDWIERLLGVEWAERVTYAENHHVDDGDGVLSGIVSRIEVVTSERELTGGSDAADRVYRPVSGGGRLRRVLTADPWEPEPRSLRLDWSFHGWLVQLGDAGYEPR